MNIEPYRDTAAMPSANDFHRPDPAIMADLYVKIQRIVRHDRGSDTPLPAVSLGLDAIDDTLPWGGLPRGALHEVIAADISAAAAGFCAMLLARLAGSDGTVAWCRQGRSPVLYGPGLAAMGLDTRRLIVVRPWRDVDLLWTMEEGLRSGALAAVLGETATMQSVALRRLQLAAESNGTAAVLLRPAGVQPTSTPAVTRWRIGAAPAASALHAGDGCRVRPRWTVELLRCRTGMAGFGAPPRCAEHGGFFASRATSWILEWRDETGGFAVAPELRHRSPAPAAAAATAT
ncbi:MAG: damage-inducible mutagenesis protein [Xanthobacteraceae bacterium]|nr:damage-inducible mutagenesis protein [Xanthobacteraceae bacterium]